MLTGMGRVFCVTAEYCISNAFHHFLLKSCISQVQIQTLWKGGMPAKVLQKKGVVNLHMKMTKFPIKRRCVPTPCTPLWICHYSTCTYFNSRFIFMHPLIFDRMYYGIALSPFVLHVSTLHTITPKHLKPFK